MAFRGRGRGRGGSIRLAKQVPFELFPEVESLGNAASVTERITLAIWHSKLQKYWNSSPYFLGEESDVLKKTKGMDIERFSDRNSERAKSKPPLSHFIMMDPAYVPAELAKGGRGGKHAAKRVRWNQDSEARQEKEKKIKQKGMQKFDLFEKLEQQSKGQDEKKKDGEDEEDEPEEKLEEEDEEFSDDGDYNQNLYDYDDDEDEYNMTADNDDEPMY